MWLLRLVTVSCCLPARLVVVCCLPDFFLWVLGSLCPSEGRADGPLLRRGGRTDCPADFQASLLRFVVECYDVKCCEHCGQAQRTHPPTSPDAGRMGGALCCLWWVSGWLHARLCAYCCTVLYRGSVGPPATCLGVALPPLHHWLVAALFSCGWLLLDI